MSIMQGGKLCLLQVGKCFSLASNTVIKRCASTGGTDLIGRHFLTLKDYNQSEIEHLLWTASDLKTRYKENKEVFQPLIGKSIAMIFQKRSTRTRLSTETGMSLLGGHAVFLGPDDIHLGVNESLQDSAKVLSRMTDVVLARVYGQSDLEELSKYSTVPIISGLSDMYHPLQILADFQTLQEHFGQLKGLKLAWVGDGNNVVHSFLMGCPKLGMDLNIATPKGYDVDPKVKEDAVTLVKQSGTSMNFTRDPMEAVAGTDVVITDTWISMGQEAESKKRIKDFMGYEVTKEMMAAAGPHAIFMHCLPRHKEEVSDEVFYDEKRSVVWQEAENRKWTVMAVMLNLLQQYMPLHPKPTF
ncbi:ornithine carbamoyltransferase, mitochondrial isoform X1 [Lingula anatina]|uniref:ornithine carbamoyltransferase n=1 Tax=Lingula anatina TaxID=7574 RepID=A0A1S3IUI2_LINAN|nr:ornithine carbamoyltransferase, mitochondrial isoform X1 [Lingula anatina]|eukprot:XP_013401194.1 ornithine carbamoyltransferase, mitochondrial isoform X1 [Lingula anatina]